MLTPRERAAGDYNATMAQGRRRIVGVDADDMVTITEDRLRAARTHRTRDPGGAGHPAALPPGAGRRPPRRDVAEGDGARRHARGRRHALGGPGCRCRTRERLTSKGTSAEFPDEAGQPVGGAARHNAQTCVLGGCLRGGSHDGDDETARRGHGRRRPGRLLLLLEPGAFDTSDCEHRTGCDRSGGRDDGSAGRECFPDRDPLTATEPPVTIPVTHAPAAAHPAGTGRGAGRLDARGVR